MTSLLLKLPESPLGLRGQKGPQFDLGNGSTVHFVSSIDGQPPFSSYKSPILKKQIPSRLDIGSGRHPKYLDNPPR
jgi:hypothetical protein